MMSILVAGGKALSNAVELAVWCLEKVISGHGGVSNPSVTSRCRIYSLALVSRGAGPLRRGLTGGQV